MLLKVILTLNPGASSSYHERRLTSMFPSRSPGHSSALAATPLAQHGQSPKDQLARVAIRHPNDDVPGASVKSLALDLVVIGPRV